MSFSLGLFHLLVLIFILLENVFGFEVKVEFFSFLSNNASAVCWLLDNFFCVYWFKFHFADSFVGDVGLSVVFVPPHNSEDWGYNAQPL